MTKIPNIKINQPKKIIPQQVKYQPKARFWSKRKKTIVSVVSAVLIVLLGGSGLAYAQGIVVYREAMSAKTSFERAKQALEKKDFDTIKQELQTGQTHLEQAQVASNKMRWLKWLPVITTQFAAVDHILNGGVAVAQAGQDITVVTEDIYSAMPDEEASFNSISDEERQAVLAKISNSPEQLIGAQQKLNYAVSEFDLVPSSGVIGPLASLTGMLKEKLPFMKEMVQKVLPLLQVAPSILGYPDEQTYLFLLQNNRELRPTGGFIGTYGTLILRDAQIEKFETNNIYNLDEPVKNTLFRKPPEPLGRYLKIDQWFMRDANWDPDFPTTAQITEDFYHAENGPIENIDGVLAVTPMFIQDLMVLTGPITVDGDQFTKENIIDTIQYQSEFGYIKKGLKNSERKVIIGKLATIIKDKLLNLPSAQWGTLLEIMIKNLDEKQVLIYSKNNQAQTLVQQLGWDGSINQPKSDFLMLVDANLSALKTDKVMEKHIDYQVTQENGDYIANLKITYKHAGIQDDKFITRYRSYARVYVPSGSQLLGSDGFLTNSEFEGGVPVEAQTTEAAAVNKTVFAGFISVEAQTSKTISLRYKLPVAMQQAVLNDQQYRLYAQKQPGTNNVTLTVSFDIGKAIKDYTPVDKIEKNDNNKIILQTPLNVDQQITASF
ncbi:MAG: DUF4012 domain-containing protein [Patescibacteria group bacterium]|jgi:hypothetical protein